MVQAANSMLHNGRNRSMEGQEHEEMPTYGNCYRCYWGGPIIIECYHCELGFFMLREEAVGPVQWSFQLIQVEDIFLDSISLQSSWEKDMMSLRQTYRTAGLE